MGESKFLAHKLKCVLFVDYLGLIVCKAKAEIHITLKKRSVYMGVQTIFVRVVQTCVCIDVDDFTNAIHRSPEFEWFGTEASVQRQPCQKALQCEYFKPPNVQYEHSQ
jgi:hypothetical protein